MAIMAVLLCSLFGTCHVAGFLTEPPTTNGGTTVVTAPENASNVTVFCRVTNPSNDNMPIFTNWFLRVGSMRMLISIADTSDNFQISGATLTNFTILSFGSSFDGETLECNNQLSNEAAQLAFFTMKIIRK